MTGMSVFPSSAPKLNGQRGQVQQQEDLGLGLKNSGIQSPGMQSTEMQNMDTVNDGPSPISPVVRTISPISPVTSVPPPADWALREGMDDY